MCRVCHLETSTSTCPSQLRYFNITMCHFKCPATNTNESIRPWFRVNAMRFKSSRRFGQANNASRISLIVTINVFVLRLYMMVIRRAQDKTSKRHFPSFCLLSYNVRALYQNVIRLCTPVRRVGANRHVCFVLGCIYINMS